MDGKRVEWGKVEVAGFLHPMIVIFYVKPFILPPLPSPHDCWCQRPSWKTSRRTANNRQSQESFLLQAGCIFLSLWTLEITLSITCFPSTILLKSLENTGHRTHSWQPRGQREGVREPVPQWQGKIQLAGSVVPSVWEAQSCNSAWREAKSGSKQQRRGGPGEEEPEYIRTQANWQQTSSH